jgi:hypothetical protein
VHGVVNELRVDPQARVDNRRADYFVVRVADHVPTGIVEDKMTKGIDGDRKTLDNIKFIKQSVAYMHKQYAFGVEHPIGLMSTYTGWRALCFESSRKHYEDLPALTEVGNLRPSPNGKNFMFWPTTTLRKTELRRIDDSVELSKVVATKIYTLDDEDVGRFVASVLWLMACNKVKDQTPRAEMNVGKVLAMRKNLMYFENLPTESVSLKWEPTVEWSHNDQKPFYALAPVYYGAHASVWFAFQYVDGSADAVMRAIKTYNRVNSSVAELEAQMWREIYDNRFPVVVTELGEQPALVMPVFARAPNNDAMFVALKETLSRFDQKGYWHSDMKWEHLAVVDTTTESLEVVVLDLASNEDEDGQSLGGVLKKSVTPAPNDWIDSTLQILREQK